MGDFSSNPALSWYLKKDLSEEILRFIDFDVIFCSFRLANQDLMKVAEIPGGAVSPKVLSRKEKN